ncbi:MAG: 16S rRNA (guanine(527)-N(7))-methyltransferase RsmG [Bacteroidales bacterium]
MEVIEKYFSNLSNTQKSQLSQLQNLYSDWNNKINVISRKDIDKLYERHVLHSLSIAKIISFKKNTTILDVGTGGGFPGIPLAIMFPDCRFHLVDSIGKKITVVKEVSKALNLKNITTEHTRVEQLTTNYDFIISRAVTSFPEFYKWVKPKISKNSFNELKNGIIYLKGGDLNEELQDFITKVKIFRIADIFNEEFFETKKIVYLPI